MKNTTTASIVIALAALSAGQAMAADSSADAIRDSFRGGADVVEPSTGQKLGDLFPALYGNVSTKTSAQVAAELAQAQSASSAGDVVEPTTGMKLSTLFPAAYATQQVASVGTRAQVRAEAVQAMSVHNAGDVVEPVTGMKLSALFASRYSGNTYN
jgi:hypothetical protein